MRDLGMSPEEPVQAPSGDRRASVRAYSYDGPGADRGGFDNGGGVVRLRVHHRRGHPGIRPKFPPTRGDERLHHTSPATSGRPGIQAALIRRPKEGGQLPTCGSTWRAARWCSCRGQFRHGRPRTGEQNQTADARTPSPPKTQTGVMSRWPLRCSFSETKPYCVTLYWWCAGQASRRDHRVCFRLGVIPQKSRDPMR